MKKRKTKRKKSKREKNKGNKRSATGSGSAPIAARRLYSANPTQRCNGSAKVAPSPPGKSYPCRTLAPCGFARAALYALGQKRYNLLKKSSCGKIVTRAGRPPPVLAGWYQQKNRREGERKAFPRGLTFGADRIGEPPPLWSSPRGKVFLPPFGKVGVKVNKRAKNHTRAAPVGRRGAKPRL